MFSLKSILSISLLTSSATAAFLPATSTSTSVLNNTTSTATAQPTITAATVHCDITYCVNGTSYCHFWAGISTWKMSGPSPGEVVTTMGVCKIGRARMMAVRE
ncbi:uncharacterized protein TRIVIDRAFT_64656 [Trichoderma virens Gv29-8]|uniref:Uncharacterized protein n=1 Tax=Hypocrea virens (strain Gv29-8 / FGSC 10586) TaxID=413071 RepID=G9NCL3_HYPVG|nr:uncharacterized protein TRIVIDRAFT_64656 [Trichoderma virens Gv29-8]EHK15435.1 hypothetical protein TRIVIDRAFT_64656 [Trichoderma virens Gv29-8]UKZ51379.1 hypothetical protein TrVGV298_005138 [Trichoderma virens]